MHPFDDDYLSKMLPGYEKKPRPAPTTPPRQEPTISEAAEKAPPQEPSAPELFDSIAAYISKYLACDQHQLTVLTLWVGYTRFFKAFFTAVYLNICSPQPQSGKSTCLMLLNALVGKPSFITGASPATLMNFLLTKTNQVDGNKFESTLFLDDCHHTFGPSERQPVVALLNSGSDASPCYFSGALEYYLFGPKAFAGNASLPRSLAARCIPITLRRRKSTDQIARLHPLEAHKHGLELVSKLVPWINNNRAAIEKVAPTSPPRIPQGHTRASKPAPSRLFISPISSAAHGLKKPAGPSATSSDWPKAPQPSNCSVTCALSSIAKVILSSLPPKKSLARFAGSNIGHGVHGPRTPERGLAPCWVPWALPAVF